MRKLASIQKIAEKRPIEGADRIEAVRVNGWWLVSKKDEFQVGDTCVYFEIDSVLPIEDRYEFLRKSCYVNKDWIEGFRLKTIRFKGQLSQGLALPMDKFPDIQPDELFEDVTDLLKVELWDPPIPACLSGVAKGHFPSFIRKTDQERIQNLSPESLAKFKDETFEMTLKMDGSSATIYKHGSDYGVCSRNLELELSEVNKDNNLVQTALRYQETIEKFCSEKNLNLAFQGELVGPGIQSNRLGLKEVDFYLFDIFDIDGHTYLTSSERIAMAEQLGMKHVEILEPASKALNHEHVIEELLTLASHLKTSFDVPNKMVEGFVCKCNNHPDFSFKVINNDYLT